MNDKIGVISSAFSDVCVEILNPKNISIQKSDKSFFIDISSKNSIPLTTVEDLLNKTREKLKNDGIYVDGIVIKNISGLFDKSSSDFITSRIDILYFENKNEIKDYLEKKEEMEKRDHRKIGQELGLFCFSPLVGSGLPMFTPEGTNIRSALFNELQRISKNFGAKSVTIPHIAKKDLYDISGHTTKFEKELFKVVSHYGEFILKPANCPHHTQIFDSQIRSYKDLPIIYVESSTQYRDEKPGELGGLTRVRSITPDDGHVFCTVDQIKTEVENIIKTIEEFYTNIGLYKNREVSLSFRDPNNKEKYIGLDEDWVHAEKILQEVSDSLNLNAKVFEGEAAIYGPKIDFIFHDSLGREQQLATIQLDFSMPKRFNLSYIDENGEKQTPVMIHRAILGSYERFIAVILEHFAGWLPCWLAPIQVAIISIGEKYNDVAKDVSDKMEEKNILTKLFQSDETLGKKIQKTKKLKIPFVIVIGEKEKDSGVLVLQKNQTGENYFDGNVDEVLDSVLDFIDKKKI